MIIALVLLLLLGMLVVAFFRLPSFGRLPSDEDMERIRQSDFYKDGKFQNTIDTPMQLEGVSMRQLIWKFLFHKKVNVQPDHALPTAPLDWTIKGLGKPVITWFGHSSYLIQLDTFNVLIDPVFSKRTSPVQFAGTKAFTGTDIFSLQDLPPIDCLLLTHDHYDHLDYNTVKALGCKVKHIYTVLGIGAHLRRWGIPESRITELDMWQGLDILPDLKLTATPARHYTGRGFKRNQALWASFVLEAKDTRLFIGGDSGYAPYFKEIGDKFGPFDLAILECGQYNDLWPYIHMAPEQTVQAALDLKAKTLLPVHWGKFALAMHPWDEPIERVLAKAEEVHLPVATPIIGESFAVSGKLPDKKWWR